MALKSKRFPAEGDFLFTIDAEPLEESVTAFGGMPLFVRAARSLDVWGSVRKHVQVKQRQKGYDEPTYIESFLVLNAVGGDCLEDFDRLREDGGTGEILRYHPPSPEAARKFLYLFHDEESIERAQRDLELGQVSYVPQENTALRGLAMVNQDVVRELGRRCPDQKIATIDLDATVIESWKREAKSTYQGGSGYQPQVALGAEMNVVVADEFRDGNVPALWRPVSVAQRAFAALPDTVQELYFRGDSACDEKTLLTWLRNEKRAHGPLGRIGFVVSARVNAALRQEIVDTPAERWEVYEETAEVEKHRAEVAYFPEESAGNRYWEPLRYVAIRIRKKKGELFADGQACKYFGVVTNLWEWKPKRLLQWHREKAGSIEAVHDVM